MENLTLANVQWITTSPNPHKNLRGYDCGQMGWRLHAVIATPETKFIELGRATALCGVRPRWGWSLDLYITDRCKRCERKIKEMEQAQ